jgi:hypothetical protein
MVTEGKPSRTYPTLASWLMATGQNQPALLVGTGKVVSMPVITPEDYRLADPAKLLRSKVFRAFFSRG